MSTSPNVNALSLSCSSVATAQLGGGLSHRHAAPWQVPPSQTICLQGSADAHCIVAESHLVPGPHWKAPQGVMLSATRHLLPGSTQAPGVTPPTLHTFPASQGVAPGEAQSGVHFPPEQRSPATAHDAPLSAAPSQSLSTPSQISGAQAAPPVPPEPELDDDDSPLELDELLAPVEPVEPVEEDDDDEGTDGCSSPEQLATRASPNRENATGSDHREEKSGMISPC